MSYNNKNSGIVAKVMGGMLFAATIAACGEPGGLEEPGSDEQVAQLPSAVTTDWTSPTSLCVQAHSSNNSGVGSSNTIYMGFVVSSKRYDCQITGGLDDGEKKCCTPSYHSYTLWSTGGSGEVYIKVNDSSGAHSADGLRYTNLTVVKGSASESRGNYNNLVGGAQCEGCALGQSCNSCWVDADGNGDNWMLYTDMGNGYTFSEKNDPF